ncbi:MAG: FAD-binding oxidoreductase [Gammaproteobacteria bacterium]
MEELTNVEEAGDVFWRRAFFSEREPDWPLHRQKHDVTVKRSEKIGGSGELWLNRLFAGKQPGPVSGDKLLVYKDGVVVYEIALDQLGRETVIGRHPDADLQLESYKLSMFHAVILQQDGNFYIESLDDDNGILIRRKKIKCKTPVKLCNGLQVDLPGYRLEFSIANTPESETVFDRGTEELQDIPAFFYTPPPPVRPLPVNFLQDRAQPSLWCEGTIRLKVADIFEESRDCKTFRLIGTRPVLFSYKPGQYITFILTIGGQEVRRSYSLSSSPSRPYLLEVTIKRLPGGLASNWFCDQVKLGDELTVTGPSGKFSCFNFPSNKILFLGAGSGITPIISMSRWITDTASAVDVKLLASFKTPSAILFRKELEMLSARHSGFQVALTVTAGRQDFATWNGFTGRVSKEMLEMFVPDILDRHIYMCGPDAFTENIKSILHDIGYDMNCFHSESFGTGRSVLDAGSAGQTLQLKGPRHLVTFAKSGLTVETDENISLLALAEAYGIELDYSCRVGSCGECEVKCKGKVEMSGECEIDAKTRKAGFVYACCCKAKSDLVLEA